MRTWYPDDIAGQIREELQPEAQQAEEGGQPVAEEAPLAITIKVPDSIDEIELNSVDWTLMAMVTVEKTECVDTTMMCTASGRKSE